MLYKLVWAIRAILYKGIFGSFGLPSYIGRPVFLMKPRRMKIGSRVRIFPGLRAECHENGRLFIHENVTIGQNFHVTCLNDLHIRSGTIISGDVMITDIDHEYGDPMTSVINQPFIHSKTDIGENCFIGFGARIQAGTVLGKGCVVGTNSVVRGEFPSHSVIVGVPARVVKRFDFESGRWERC
ncbi:Acetyltransferase (isoleucine patch superfamily) [Marinobacter sp. DSM 26671]|uniref:acyltransferase n=1 Tax=Marinobacter sp. DSM 26671 TaxID=1761793 RepID=UPI0008E79BFD|nr:acyltransferase [Marinobacter sp. DSM 26671]SFE23808.1 Acetyltransferase (isoleucine patch superfamily) [Marinobacter sp. DSM 26671]